MAAEKPSDWDRYIPALLFSYREVAQASLVFSPFEVVYGRSVSWTYECAARYLADEDINEQTKTTYQYVLELRERLESTRKLGTTMSFGKHKETNTSGLKRKPKQTPEGR